jgi:hypothetical protein
MRRALLIVALLAAGLTLTACGGTNPETGPEAEPADVGALPPETASLVETGEFTETSEFAETGGGEPAVTSGVPEPTPDPPIPELKPPPIVLETEAGRQEAVQGSYCITRVNDEGEGEGICADAVFPHPDELSVVRPGDTIAITLEGADIVTAAGCSQASTCPIVTLYALGCGPERAIGEFELTGSTTTWTVELEPGAYELWAFAYFDDGMGASGDTSGAVGLLVDPKLDPDRGYEMPAAIDPFVVCPFPQEP